MSTSYNFHLECSKCGWKYDANSLINYCSKCGSLLEVKYDHLDDLNVRDVLQKARDNRPNSIWRYKELLPAPLKKENIVTMGEGSGDLILLKRASEIYGLNIYAKYYGSNPTATHKDLGMSVAVSMALESGLKKAVTFSTGNAGTSLAAYCSRAGIPAIVVGRKGISEEKLANLLALGANFIAIENLSDPWTLLKELSNLVQVYYFTNFINPFRAEGHKTLAYDIFQTLGDSASFLFEPLGTGGGIWGSWKGFKELKQAGLVDNIPRIFAVQPEAVRHAAVAFEKGNTTASPFGNGNDTLVQSLADSVPLFGDERPLSAVYDTRGKAISAPDRSTAEAISLIGKEGLFVEPASACAFAGLVQEIENGTIRRGETVVVSLTGSGLKQPDFLARFSKSEVKSLSSPDAKKLAEIVNGV